mgnify:CR=1 FL=1|jgi:hypothetical protein
MKETIKRKRQETKKKTNTEMEYYVDGNVVRKVETSVPKKAPKTSAGEVAKTNRMIRKNRERALSMDLPYLVVMSAAVAVMLLLCVNYIAIQSKLTSTIKQTQKNESNLEKLRNENDSMENMIATYVDLDHIYDVATNKLGMIYARKNQVITYEKTESEYVRQFEDIPR